MKKLLSSLILFASAVFGQTQYPFTVTPTTGITGIVNLNAPASIQQISTPFTISFPSSVPYTNKPFSLSATPAPDINNNINSSMFSFTINGPVAEGYPAVYTGTVGILEPGQSANVYLNVDTSKLLQAPGGYTTSVYITDSTTGLVSAVVFNFSVVGGQAYIYPANNVRVVPHIASGFGWQTTLQFTNPNSSNTQLNVSFANQNGSPFNLKLADGRFGSLFYVTVPAHGTTNIVVADPTNTNTLIATATIIPVSGYPAGITAIYQNLGAVPHVAAVAAQQVTTNALTMFYDNTTGNTTGLVLMNSLNVSEPVTLMYYDENGNLLETTGITLAAGGQVALQIHDPVLAGHSGTVHAFMPFAALNGFALRFDSNFFFIPVEPILY